MQEIKPEEISIVECHNCGAEQKLDYRFCNKCGAQNIKSFKNKLKKDRDYNKNLKYLAIYTLILLPLLVISSFTMDEFHLLVIWTISFAVLDIIFASIQPEVWRLFKIGHLKLKPLLLVVLIGLVSAVVVHVSVEKLNLFLDLDTYKYDEIFGGLEYSLIYGIVLIALFPAIFEELAFRGFIFNNLERLAGKKSAIWGSSFLFGLVHFSLLSLYWLIPFGLILAYFRNKYNTLLYGIVGHFVHNATITVIDHYQLF